MSVADVADVEVSGIAAGGDGVARAGGLVVFVPRTAPGDLARVRLRRGRHFARGGVEHLLRPGPDRVEPPCAHYTRDRCGGCQLQHISYAGQLEAKRAIIQDSVRRIGRREVEVPDVRPSDRPWRYRRKLTLTLRRAEDRWVAGLHPYDDPVNVFQLVDCPISDERVVSVWREVFAAERHYPEARSLRAAIRLVADRAVMVVEGGSRWPEARRFFEAVPALAALWWEPEGAPRRRLAERGAVPAGASFGQVNAQVAAALRDEVLHRARTYAPARVVDAYAGTGDTAVALAGAGATVIAIELDRDAAEVCGRRLPPGSRALVGRVEEVLPTVLPADLVVLNPPRGGLDARATATLSAADPPPRGVIYVSCNPGTLARDLTRLPRFRVVSVLGFDMFPQTAHVETLCELVPGVA
ncbi:MAG: class I SAM-dependent RNA methyltransferase [Gemmatimonadaceae bacterium]